MSKGAYLYTIRHEGDGANLFASKSFIAPDGKNEAVWSIGEQATDSNVKTILRRIEAEILSNHETKDAELAELFLKVRNREISFEEFENFMLKDYENNHLKPPKIQEKQRV